MKALFCVPLLFAAILSGDHADDRAAIDSTIAALNNPATRDAALSKDADVDVNLNRLMDLHRSAIPGAVIGITETWTALTQPTVVRGSIRFLTPDVATVDGASTVEGAQTLRRRVPLFFVLRREGATWKITIIRRLH